MKVTIEERGNGFPEIGAYVPGDDGDLYLVDCVESNIHTGSRAGLPNYVHASVIIASWEDCTEEEEFTAMCIIPSFDIRV